MPGGTCRVLPHIPGRFRVSLALADSFSYYARGSVAGGEKNEAVEDCFVRCMQKTTEAQGS